MRMRLDIETRVASTLAITATEADIDVLRSAIAAQRQAAMKRIEPVWFLEEAARFHQLLATTGKLSTWCLSPSNVGGLPTDRRNAGIERTERDVGSCPRQHEDLLQYIEMRDSDAASESMRKHLESTLNRMSVPTAS